MKSRSIQKHPCQLLKTVPTSKRVKLHLCIDALWAFSAKHKYNKSKDVNQNVTLYRLNSERLLYHHRGQRMYGYQAVLEASERGGTYEKGVMLETFLLRTQNIYYYRKLLK